MNGTNTPLKIAILINGFESPNTPLVRYSFVAAIKSALPSALPPAIDFFDPIVAQIYPEPSKYDLIVLSGGTADPMGAEPWVLKMQNFLRTTVAEHPSQKLVGICWGHQTMCVAFGGIVGNMDGPEIGVTEVELTAEGRKMFPPTSSGRLQIHEFHRRDIKISAKGFLPLAEKNQAFLNENNTILTFQGHPEMNAGLAKQMLASAPGYMGVQGAKKDALAQRMESHHDGTDIWKRILAWVGQ